MLSKNLHQEILPKKSTEKFSTKKFEKSRSIPPDAGASYQKLQPKILHQKIIQKNCHQEMSSKNYPPTLNWSHMMLEPPTKKILKDSPKENSTEKLL